MAYWHNFEFGGRSVAERTASLTAVALGEHDLSRRGELKTFVARSCKTGELLGSASLVTDDMEGAAKLRGDPGASVATPWLSCVFVVKAVRSKGIGGQLVRAVAEDAQKLGHTSLHLYTTEFKSFEWYSKMGFKLLYGNGNPRCSLVYVMYLELGDQDFHGSQHTSQAPQEHVLEPRPQESYSEPPPQDVRSCETMCLLS